MSDITHHLFVIEYDTIARKEGSDNELQLQFVYQSTSSIHDANTTDFTVNSKEFKNGKTILVLEQNGTSISTLFFTFITQNPSIVINYIFKYYSIAAIGELHPTPTIESISSISRGNRVYTTFKEIIKNPTEEKITQSFYMVRLYSDTNFTNLYDLDNIYPLCDQAYDQRNTTVTNTGKEYTISQLVEDSINGTLYANVLASYNFTDGRQERLSYKYTTVVVRPKQLVVPKQKRYLYLSLNERERYNDVVLL